MKDRKLLYNNPWNETGTLVQEELSSTVKIFCKFDMRTYPMDSHDCQFRVTIAKLGRISFVWHDPGNAYPIVQQYGVDGFKVIVTTYGNSTDPVVAGADIQISRFWQPYVLKYILPCFMIVIVSQISFIVPLNALPGRIGLGVTQFLTLTNIFISSMVRIPA